MILKVVVVRLSCFTCLRCAGSLVLFPAPRGGEIGREDLRFP
ncbi:hypothetical protein T03_9820 [Trichinella britovi]|uniref:Uncharacterized protein n=1 Tax=Trichinella britovi TaxID=45882 RepID=A0A0V0Z1G0_TRIBR|nr:hypothetical protein T03_9820 [Trichinella britovi]